MRKIPDVTVTVSAPATNQTAQGGKTTPGALRAKRSTTISGYPAIAVQGFPADSINYALRTAARRSRIDLVITGINPGINPGMVLTHSGTIGAARAAARRGLPALATSIGGPHTTNFTAAVKDMTAWVQANRTRLKRGTVLNMNLPNCAPGGRPRPIVRSITTDGIAPGIDPWAAVDCRQKAPAVRDEFANLQRGFATLTRIPLR